MGSAGAGAVRKTTRIVGAYLTASFKLAVQYRVEFFVGSAMTLFWVAWSLAPALVAWSQRSEIAGWTFHEALLVIAWFMLLRALLEGAVQPSLIAVIEHIRKGTLDFVLLKPVDAQLLVSVARAEPRRAFDVVIALGVAAYAFFRLGRTPDPLGVVIALVLTLTSALLLYSLAILVVSAAFWVVRLDNLLYLFNAIFDAARWPASVFRGVLAVLFTFVIPLALMTTYPALALLGRLSVEVALLAVLGSLLFSAMARAVWKRALSRYTSASS